jgi:hypothetical protein
LKGSPLLSGGLQSRIQKLLKGNQNDPNNAKYVRSLVIAIKNALENPKYKADVMKKLGGNINALRTGRQSMLAETMTSADIVAFTKEVNTLLPNIVGLTFELRQMVNKKNPNVVKEAESAVDAASTGTEIDASDIKQVKLFLSRLIDLSTLLESFDPIKATKASLKPIISVVLDINDMIVGTSGKKGLGKVDKTIDSAFQGIDILGGTDTTTTAGAGKETETPSDSFKPKEKTIIRAKAEEKPLTPNSMYQYYNGEWNYVSKTGFQAIDPEKGKNYVDKLNSLAKSGRDDTDDVMKLSNSDKKFDQSPAFKNLKEEFISPDIYREFYK